MATNDERDEEFRRIANRIQYTYSGPATTLTTSMSITWGEVERSTEPSWRGTHYFSTASVVPGNRIYFTNPSQWGYIDGISGPPKPKEKAPWYLEMDDKDL